MNNEPDITLQLPDGKVEMYVTSHEGTEKGKKDFISRVAALLALDMSVVDAVRDNKRRIDGLYEKLDG